MFTKQQMEQALENLDRRLAAIEQKLPTLATRQDVERLSRRVDELSKIDLEAMRHEFQTHTEWVDKQFAGLRGEFGELRGEFGELRREFGELRGEFAGLRPQMDLRFGTVDRSLEDMTARMVSGFDRVAAQLERLQKDQ